MPLDLGAKKEQEEELILKLLVFHEYKKKKSLSWSKSITLTQHWMLIF